MITLGGFETTRELYRGGSAVVLLAKPVGAGSGGGGSGSGSVAIKLVRVDPGFASAEHREAIEAEFLRAAMVQGAAAKHRAAHERNHWAPVHDSGRGGEGDGGGGAWFATEVYDGSAQRLIDGRVKLDSAGLGLIVGSVLRGLIELRDAKGRRHGNLKPSNILYQGGAGGADSAMMKVVLADPAPTGAGLSLAGDLRVLGEIVYQLVVHQSFRARSGWPVPMSEEWSRLEHDGQGWLALCNRLLDPRLADQSPSLEGFLEELKALGRPVRKGRGVMFAGAGVVLALAAGAGAFWLLREPPPPPVEVVGEPFDEAAWMRLCDAYYEWFGVVSQTLSPGAAASPLRTRFGGDAFLSGLGTALGDDVAKYNPQEIASSTRDVKTLATQVPDAARTGEAVLRTREALAVVERVEAMLSSEGLTEWRLFAEASRLVGASELQGWEGATEHLGGLVRAIRPSSGVLTALEEFLDAAPLIAAIDRLEKAVVRSEELDDPVLKTLGATVAAAMPAGRRTAELVRDIGALDELVRPLSEVLASEWDLLDHELFAESEAHRAHANDPTPRPELFSIWLAEARSPRYRLLTEPDPREPARWNELRAEVIAGIARLVDEFEVDPAQGPADFRSRMSRIEDDIEALSGLKWNTAGRAEVMQGSQRVRAELGRLSVDVNNSVRAQVAFANQSLEEVRGQLAGMDNIAPSGSAVIDSVWRRERDRVLAAESTVAALRDRSGALQSLLRAVDDQVPAAMDLEAGRARDWSGGIDAVAQQQREVVLAGILERVEWTAGIPTEVAVSREELEAFEGWREELSLLMADMGQVEDRLNGLYPLAQRTELGALSVDELTARWGTNQLMQDAGIQAALSPVLQRVEGLRQLGRSVDRAELLTAAADVGNPARAMAAWRRLGEQRDVGGVAGVPWPAVRQSLDDEARLQRLLEGVAASAPAERRTVIREELVAQGQRRWAAHMAAASTAEEIRAAAMMKEGLRGDDAMLEPRALFNLRLYELELVQQEGLADEELKARIEAFRAIALQVPALAELDPVRTLTAELGELTSDSGAPPPIDVTMLGPGDPLVGWQGEVSPDGQQVVFRTRIGNADQVLTFVRVEPGGGEAGSAPPAFVCTEETTVGLFSAVVGQGEAWEPIRSFLLSWDLADPRQGPRTWQWTTGRAATVRPMIQARSWLVSNPDLAPDGPNEPYPTGTGLPPPAPSLNHPMQYISPVSAMAAARLIGCRLPTTAEWEAAMGLELAGAQLPAYMAERRPNLRDQTWFLQKQHVDALVASRRLGAANSIPPAAGSFWREQPDAFWEGYDDGALWPVPADQGGAGAGRVFQHLIGNVAELVFDVPEAIEAIPAGSMQATAVQAALTGEGAIGVIGGSAQSPPQIDPAQRQVFPASSMGYADVGFRLAFSATGSAGRIESLVARLGRILETPRFVPPG